jgi:hypothetical protein
MNGIQGPFEILDVGFTRDGEAGDLRTLRLDHPRLGGIGTRPPFLGHMAARETIITFPQVFLIQNTQNRDGAAIQAKLDELIRASAAHNRFIGVEDLTEEELAEMRPNGAKTERLRDVKDAADEAEVETNKLAAEAADKAKPSIR